MTTQENVRDEIIDELLSSTKSAEDLFGKEGLLKNLTKRLMERLLEAEMAANTYIFQLNIIKNGSSEPFFIMK